MDKTLISSFGSASYDWSQVRDAANQELYIVPHNDVDDIADVGADGLFNWDAWPSKNNQPSGTQMTTELAGDQSFIDAVGDSGAYMPGVSPWFSVQYALSHFFLLIHQLDS